MPFSHVQYFQSSSPVTVEDVEEGDVVQFNYRNQGDELSLKNAFVLYVDESLIHCLELENVSPEDLVDVFESLATGDPEAFQQSYPVLVLNEDKTAFESWYDDNWSRYSFANNPYRTFRKEAMYNVRRITYETDVQR
jgi:hypothetical protein